MEQRVLPVRIPCFFLLPDESIVQIVAYLFINQCRPVNRKEDLVSSSNHSVSFHFISFLHILHHIIHFTSLHPKLYSISGVDIDDRIHIRIHIHIHIHILMGLHGCMHTYLQLDELLGYFTSVTETKR